MSPFKVKDLQEAKRYFRKTQPVKLKPFEKRLEDLEKKQTEFNTRLNYIMKKLLEIDLKIH